MTLRPTLSQAQCSENVLVVLIPLGGKGRCRACEAEEFFLEEGNEEILPKAGAISAGR